MKSTMQRFRDGLGRLVAVFLAVGTLTGLIGVFAMLVVVTLMDPGGGMTRAFRTATVTAFVGIALLLASLAMWFVAMVIDEMKDKRNVTSHGRS